MKSDIKIYTTLFVITAYLLLGCEKHEQSIHNKAMICINDNNYTELNKLLKSNPNLVQTVDSYDRRTLLHTVFSKGYFDDNVKLLSDLLIEAGSEINSVDDRGMTPAHCAVYYSNSGEEALNYLVSKGANIDLKDKKGKTPRDYLKIR